jgi:asparagine synthase (glutamine-hydrolysing)
MCGIAGIFTFNESSLRITHELLRSVGDTIRHRGPDDNGTYVNEKKTVGFAHRRLSIIDLSPQGRQPMANEDQSIWITYNGEIYNHAALRENLERKGHRYRSRTDTETILHLYEEKGAGCLDDLEGMFAFALWDEKKQLLFLARDRFGKKPLYYSHTQDSFCFASEIKALLRFPQVKKEVDYEGAYHFLTFASTPAPFTLFKGIKKLAPGHSLVIDARGKVTQVRYWDVAAFFKHRRDTHAMPVGAQEVRRLLIESMKKRLMSDVPIGIFLSGGLDSSLNVAILSKFYHAPLETFTIGFKDQPEYNEFQFARRVATQYNTTHHEISMESGGVRECIQDFFYYQDDPLCDPTAIPFYFLSRRAHKEGMKVVILGEGSDEIFFGYDFYLRAIRSHAQWRRLSAVPGFIRNAAYRASKALGVCTGKGDSAIESLRRLSRGESNFWGGAIGFSEFLKEKIIKKESGPLASYDSYSVIKEYFSAAVPSRCDVECFAQQLLRTEINVRLPEILLMKVDKVLMSSSLEGRAPYLDRSLAECVAGFPLETFIRAGEGKSILKKIAEEFLPPEIVHRKKQGFRVPFNEWLGRDLRRDIYRVIVDSRLMGEVCDMRSLNAFVEKDGRRRALSFEAWVLFQLCLWFDFWFLNERPL